LLFFEDFILAIPSKWTGDRHFQVSVASADDVADTFVELMFFKYFVTISNLIITDLPIGDEDNVLVFFSDDFLRDTTW
jgi:hypothetical protein